MSKLYYLLIALCIGGGASQAEVPGDSLWTYSQCVDYAKEHNISLRKSELVQSTDAVNISEAKAQWQPTLDFATTQGYANYPWGVGAKNNYNSSYGLNAGWTVWDGGIRTKNIERNRVQLAIDRLSTDDNLRTLRTDILQVYLNILYAREAIAIAREASETSLAQAQRAKALMESGRLSRVDYSRLNSQYEQDRYSVVNAEATYRTRCMELKSMLELGIDDNITLAPIQWEESYLVSPLPPITDSYKLALSTDPQMQGLELEQKISDLDVSIAGAGRAPKIALQAGVGTGWNAPGIAFGTGLKQSLNESVGLSLQLPIFDQKKTSSAIERAKINQQDAELDVDRRRTELSQIIENWYVDTNSARAKYRAAKAALESAELTDQLTNEQFAIGYINTVELMDAHNAYIQARHSVLQAKYMALLGLKMIEFWRTGTVSL